MILKQSQSVERKSFSTPGASEVQMQTLCGPDDGCPNFAMRKFSLAPGGFTPMHKHDFEHEVYILAGEGSVYGNGKHQKISAGDVLYMPANEPHQFKTDAGAKSPLEFLCMVPAFVHRPGCPMPTLVDCAAE